MDLLPNLEDPATPEHLSYHLSTWHMEGQGWLVVTDESMRQWQVFHQQIVHPAGTAQQRHTHTGRHR
jgi:hypothetical protein